MSSKGSILIVESDDLIRQLLEAWLREAGYTATLDTADAAPGAARHDLVILNVAEPRASVDIVRALEARHRAPVLVVSARFRRGLARSGEAARHLGVRRVLPKPFTRAELMAAVEESIEKPS